MPDNTVFRPGFLSRLFGRADWRLDLAASSFCLSLVEPSGETELTLVELTSVDIVAGFPWHSVKMRAGDRSFRLGGLGVGAARRLHAALTSAVMDTLDTMIRSDTDRLLEIDGILADSARKARRYLSVSDLEAICQALPRNAAEALTHTMFDGVRLQHTIAAVLPASYPLLTDPEARRRHNEVVVEAELEVMEGFFDDLGGRSLSRQQREACIRLEDNNLLVACAGSGKSATMVGKVAYLLERNLVRPEEILVLAFNRNAAEELTERLATQLKVERSKLGCRVTTFHGLGLGIVREVEGRPPRVAEWVQHPAAEAKVLEGIISELVRADPWFKRLWVDLLVLYPKADLARETFDSEADYQRYVADRKSGSGTTIGSLSGTYVRSLQERSIANWLWLNTVDFEYERQIEVPDGEGGTRHLHPDFYYPGPGTIHEHFAIDADGTSPFEGYVEAAQSKRQAYAAMGLDFFETRSAEATAGTLIETLEGELTNRGVSIRPRSLDEVTAALQPIVIKHYHQLIGTCIKHIRSQELSLEELLDRADKLGDTTRARIFAQVVHRIAQAYTRKLEDDDRIDFDSMIADATRLVEDGRYNSPYRIILADEFQDIAGPSAALIKALRASRAGCKLFAVGDDWQAINGFAGSDIALFTRFADHFGAGWQGRLETTYRCNQLIAGTAASFVQRNPGQLAKSVGSVRPAIRKSVRIVPVAATKGKPDFKGACLAILARLDRSLGALESDWRTVPGSKLKVMVLWRYNHLNPFDAGSPRFENIEAVGKSFHRSKGLEADYTILMDVSEGDYGVPSRIEDDELIRLVRREPETFPYAEERRLFYVALTRAVRGVFILSDDARPSRFIKELCEIAGDDVRFEDTDGRALQECPKCRVGHPVERRAKSGKSFMGCSQFPECKYTAPIAATT